MNTPTPTEIPTREAMAAALVDLLTPVLTRTPPTPGRVVLAR